MYKTSALNNIGGFTSMPAGWGSDDITSYKIAKVNGIVFVNEILCNWRKSGENISSSHKYYYEKMLAILKYKSWISEFIHTLDVIDSNKWFFGEIKEKSGRELDVLISELGTRLIVYSRPAEFFRNLRICRKEFNIGKINILGALIESFGKKLKARISKK
jgi:hypothetical protein